MVKGAKLLFKIKVCLESKKFKNFRFEEENFERFFIGFVKCYWKNVFVGIC